MALDLTPMRWDWSPVVTGDSYPAAQISATGQTEDLERVRITFRASGSTASALTLDSETSGITITDAASWAFTIATLEEVPLSAGQYSYQLETTSTAGTVRTHFMGNWKILTDGTP